MDYIYGYIYCISQLGALCTGGVHSAETFGSDDAVVNNIRSPVRRVPRQQYMYTRERLYNYRRASYVKPSRDVLDSLKQNGILRYRGCRSGSHKQHRISTIYSNRSTYRSAHLHHLNTNPPRERCVTNVPTSNTNLQQQNGKQAEFPVVYVINAASLAKPHALDLLAADIRSLSVDIAIITETHYKKHHAINSFSIDGFNCVRRDRVGRRGGGVAFYIKNDITFSIVSPSGDQSDFETLWLNVSWNNHSLTCVAVYHPPRPIYNTDMFKNFLFSNIDDVCAAADTSLLVAGDFNQLADDEICQHTGLQSLVRSATRGTSCLDRIYTSSMKTFCVKIVTSTVKSDHKAIILCNEDFSTANVKVKKSVTFRSKSPAQHASVLDILKYTDFTSVFNNCDLEACYTDFYSTVMYIFETYYPERQVTLTDRDPPFITPEIKSLLRKKNQLMRKGDAERANAIAEKVRHILIRSNTSRLTNLTDSSTTIWDEVRKITGAAKRQQIPSCFNAEQINQHYCNVSTDPTYSEPSRKLSALGNKTCKISEHQVFTILDKLTATATGSDNLPFWFLRLCAPYLAAPLAHIFTLSLDLSLFPSAWKLAYIHPVPKITNPTTPSDLRPISVVPILSRVFEKIVNTSVLLPALSHLPPNLDISNQFAYRPTGSTTAALVAILSHISDMLKTDSHVFVITFDYSKAFDTLRHTSVTEKLAQLEIPDNVYNWVVDYLAERKHCTQFSNSRSSPLEINASIVQGSVLGPTLFNINSTDLQPLSPLNKYFKYADDAYLIVPGRNAHFIQKEIDHHSEWAARCNLRLNPTKTAEIVFCRKGTASPPPNLGIQRQDSIKILGVTVDNKRTFSDHIACTLQTCHQNLIALKIMRNYGLSAPILRTVFKCTVISRLLYASPAWWGYTTANSKNSLAAFLRKAVKFGFYSDQDPDIFAMQIQIERNLFASIQNNTEHALHGLLPPRKKTNYNLRTRGHSFVLPPKDDKNFITRCLYNFI